MPQYLASLGNSRVAEHVFLQVNEPQCIKSWNVIANNALDSGADIIIMGNDDMAYVRRTGINVLKRNSPSSMISWFVCGSKMACADRHCAFPMYPPNGFKLLAISHRAL